MELKDVFNEVAGRPVAPTMQQVDADLSRGRGALRKRRGLQAAGGSIFAVAAAVAAFAVATSGTAAGPGNVEAQAPPAAASAQSIKLVAWTGKQPKGFTVDKVPDGWFVQGLNEYELVIAPNKAKNPGPNVDPSKAPVYDPGDYRDKIAVFLQSKDEDAPQGKKVDVDGTEVIFRKTERINDANTREPKRADGDYGASVFVKQPSGVYLVTQFWAGLGFSEKQMTELAAGMHAAKNAVQGVG